MGDLYVEIWGNYWKKKFFINQKKIVKKNLQTGNLVWTRNMWGGLSGPIEILCNVWRRLRGLQWKNGEATEGWDSIVKCGETLFPRGSCENSMQPFTCDGPIETDKYIWWISGGCLIGFCHKTAEIHFLCIQLIN